MPVVSALLGHAVPGVTGLYIHADRRTLIQAMNGLWEEFEIE